MKKSHLLFVSLFLCLSATVFSQPLNYTPGTQVCWTYNGRPHGYFKAAGNGERHILISFTGDGETNCSNYQSQAPQKWLRDNGVNWDGRTVRAPGDTVVWEVLTIAHTSSYYLPDYAADINYFFQNIAPIDTSDHTKFHIEGLSGGVGRFWGYLVNDQSHNSPYRHIFSTTISQSGAWVGVSVGSYVGGKRHWVWYGTADANGGTPPAASVALYNALSETKHLTAQVGGTHSANTWDSCMSLAGTDTTTNRWLWMVKPQEEDTITPPPCPDPGGGPANYVPGTQVCWTFNGRPHGYFRAEGCGQRHILLAFTGDGETDCNNYQTQSPQKLLNDLGINWNGKTVRAPGDTILWEVLTIANTSSYWLAAYASDIDYFFSNINLTGIDTSDHRRFHAVGLSGGVGRMWGYLVNDQTHNSPYRNLFGTTISMSPAWLGIYSQITAYSTGRRHWVWHGAADANGSTPPAAGQGLYNILNGAKRLTLQAGGTHSANTWDSCMSLAGTDSSSNRWLWMVIDPAGPPYRLANPNNGSTIRNSPIQKGSIYPNPARNKVVLALSNAEQHPYRITIVDAMGRRHRVITNVAQSNYVLDIGSLRNGLYIIQIENGQQRTQQKVIKE